MAPMLFPDPSQPILLPAFRAKCLFHYRLVSSDADLKSKELHTMLQPFCRLASRVIQHDWLMCDDSVHPGAAL
eukprot:scaffold624059_cov47-Prasinocladus_malaysianus.AAC.1